MTLNYDPVTPTFEHARRCRVCGRSLEGRRSDARTCSARCRREANRLEHLLAGREDTGYRSLDEYLARRQRRERIEADALAAFLERRAEALDKRASRQRSWTASEAAMVHAEARRLRRWAETIRAAARANDDAATAAAERNA